MAATDLADRWRRLVANVIDGLLWSVATPFLNLGAAMQGHEGSLASAITDPASIPLFSPPSGGSPALVNLGWTLFIVQALLQVFWLTSRGQTLGKLILGIRIVRMDTGKSGGFVTNVLLRIVVFNLVVFLAFLASTFLIGLLGVTGFLAVVFILIAPLLLLGDVLFVFTAERRCLHDMMAGTQVVKA
jgi:uncharacterized RDD family membrane protein YckC